MPNPDLIFGLYVAGAFAAKIYLFLRVLHLKDELESARKLLDSRVDTTRTLLDNHSARQAVLDAKLTLLLEHFKLKIEKTTPQYRITKEPSNV